MVSGRNREQQFRETNYSLGVITGESRVSRGVTFGFVIARLSQHA